MKVAMLFASWEKFGETWSTPQGIRNEFVTLGHDVRQYNLYHDDGELLPNRTRRYSNQGINQLYKDFIDKTFVPDIILAMDYGPWDSLQFDKQYFPGVTLVSEAGDEPQSHRQHMAKAFRVHCVLSPDRECVERYKYMGCNAIYWTHHADTKLFYPNHDVPEIFDCVTTCGPRGAGLTETIKNELGELFNNERYFYGAEHAIRLNMGKMVFQKSQYGEVTRRIFEGMACGKMVITDRLRPETGLQDLFIDGTDIVYYDNAQDAIDKIRYYASHDNERLAIAENGYRKVLENHTCTQRVNDILQLEVTK